MAQTKLPRPKLGSWHIITQRAEKDISSDGKKVKWVAEPIEDDDARRGHWEWVGEGARPAKMDWDDWQNWEWQPSKEYITEYKAMYVGYRHKRNGTRHSGGAFRDEYDPSYLSIESIQEVWMFVTHENRNPIPVMPFEIELKGLK